MAAVTNLISESNLTSSSYDSTSTECNGGRCKVNQIANDNAGHTDEDRTFWQSAADPSCSNQWIQSIFEETSTVNNFTIEYDSFGAVFNAQNPYFQVLLNPTSSSPIDVSSAVTCKTETVANSGAASRVDDCVFKTPQTNVDGVKFTWGLTKYNGTCQMNVDEIIMFGTPGATKSSGLSAGAIAGITIGVVAVVVFGVFYGIRQQNIKRRERTGRV
ncbi:UNVERIFIED_CONTAM: hypothetical protein HDU68_010969 [Siphonaria sp. JEL0065]|nr:hypothetical protein HDU68_010969 [Siphonaria sp. JEL0065]